MECSCRACIMSCCVCHCSEWKGLVLSATCLADGDVAAAVCYRIGMQQTSCFVTLLLLCMPAMPELKFFSARLQRCKFMC